MVKRLSLQDSILPDYREKKSDRLLLLSNFVPTQTYKLNGLKISPYKRASVRNKNFEMYQDSLALEYENKDYSDIERWVLFHSFIISSWATIPSYQGTTEGEIIFSENPCIYFEDFDDIAGLVYFPQKPQVPKLSYRELYEKFIAMDLDDLGLVKNIMTHLNPITHTTFRIVTDASYWQLMVYYSVIEAMIGRGPSCDGELVCTKCETETPHNLLSAKDWITQRIQGITDNSPSSEQYINYIWSVRQKIRHKTTHESIHPKAKHVVQTERHVEYDLKRSIGDYDKDSTALLALTNGTHDIARYLLLDYLYGFKVFPEIDTLKSLRIIST